MTGQLSAIHFSEGQEVKKGQLLFTLDPRPFEAALEQAQAVLARDTAKAKNAQSQQARYEDLYKRGLIPRDQYETQAATASSLQATLAADQAAVETAKLNLQYHEHHRADRRAHRCLDGPPGRSRPCERHDAAGRDQPAGADLRDVLGSGPIPAGHPALPGAESIENPGAAAREPDGADTDGRGHP